MFCMRFERALNRVQERAVRRVGLQLSDCVKWMDIREIYYVDKHGRFYLFVKFPGIVLNHVPYLLPA